MFKERLLIGQYYAIDSPIHRLKAEVKIIAALIYMIVIFVVDDWIGWIFLTSLAFVAIGLSRIPLKALWHGSKLIFIFCFFTILINLFLFPGELTWHIGILTITKEGLIYGFAMGLRLLLIVLFASLLTLTTMPITLTDALEKLLSPLQIIRISAHEIAMMMSIAIRFIPTILEELDRIALAQRARGIAYNQGNLIKRIKGFIPILIPLFISVFRRAEELAIAMDARCYRGSKGRSKWRNIPWRFIDIVILIAFIFLFVGAIIYRIV